MANPSEANDILLTTLNVNEFLGRAYTKFENGLIQDTYDGKIYRRYHDNGMLHSYGHYINNKCEGIYIGFYINGRLDIYEQRKNGKTHGFAIRWNEDGSIYEKLKYVENVIVKNYMKDHSITIL